jgi:tetratricopeptide (TPR) repeat protein
MKIFPKVSLTALAVSMCLVLPVTLAGLATPAMAKGGKNTAEPASKNLKLGKQLLEKKDYDGAIDALLQSTYFARNGYAPDSFYYLGMAYKGKGDYRKALEALKRHCEQAVDRAPLGHLELAEVQIELKEYEAAERNLWEAQSAAAYPSALFFRCRYVDGKLHDITGDASGALDRYRDALGDKPWKFYDAWIAYCECFMKVKKWVEAYQSLEQLLHSNEPMKGMSYERVHLDMGICLLAKGNHQGAIDNWHRCLEYNPENREAHLQLAMILESEKHYSSAIKEYREFIRLSPTEGKDPRARQAETRIALIERKLNEPEPGSNHGSESPLLLRQRQRQIQEQARKQAELRHKELEEKNRLLQQGDPGF